MQPAIIFCVGVVQPTSLCFALGGSDKQPTSRYPPRARRSGCLHESPDIRDVPSERVIGERLDKNSTILHALDAVLEDGMVGVLGEVEVFGAG